MLTRIFLSAFLLVKMTENNPIILQVKNLNKSFLGVKALENICFELKKGEIHALMGENGAGKSTFMKILMGLLSADSGEIIFEGSELKKVPVNEMLQKGISMIHQEILAIPELTVAQNIYLGNESVSKFWLNEQAINRKAQKLLEMMEVSINSSTKIKHLSIAEKQMVEIAKAISNEAKVIIMDEPTSALSDKEVSVLFRIMKDLKAKGVSIIYISHKMDEVYTLSDRITVLRDGQYIATKNTAELNKKDLISLMVGREIEYLYPENSQKNETKQPILTVKNLSKKGKFENINFEIYKGEVLGIAGLMGAGRTEIARAIYGLDSYESGEIGLNGEVLLIKSSKEAIKKGIGYVSEDRKALGFIPEMSVKQNLSLSSLPSLSKYCLVQDKKEEKIVSKIAIDLKVKASNLNQKVINLSGGNQQKVVIGKVLLANPSIIILDEPTRGIDIGAKFEIYKLIRELTEKGIAILMISSELPEILGMSDRILVLSKGRQKAILSKNDASQEKIMQFAME